MLLCLLVYEETEQHLLGEQNVCLLRRLGRSGRSQEQRCRFGRGDAAIPGRSCRAFGGRGSGMLCFLPIRSRETLRRRRKPQLGTRSSEGVSGLTGAPRRHRPQSKRRDLQAFSSHSFLSLNLDSIMLKYNRVQDKILLYFGAGWTTVSTFGRRA